VQVLPPRADAHTAETHGEPLEPRNRVRLKELVGALAWLRRGGVPERMGDSKSPGVPPDLGAAITLAFAPLVLGFPLMAVAVFGAGYDRHSVARVFSAVYPASIYLALSTPFWPLPALRGWTPARRLEAACLIWIWFTCLTHVTWELAWLFLHDAIARSPEAPWAYAWWAYIDGGDRRFLEAPATLLVMEALSVTNGAIGLAGLWLRARSHGGSRTAVLLFMTTAVVHLYSTTLYYGSEILAGFPSVDTTNPADLWLKFALANSPWLVMPWAVLVWGWRTLAVLPAAPQPTLLKATDG
jgi:hypothetical protein